MPVRHVVVDGSNIATEGRNLPNLAQLDQAVREFLAENPDDIITVVVDASFAHRIDPSELQAFEEAEAEGEVVSPPAGAIGRGDAFLLRIAEKTGATVLSNDSFQEFHGEHDWLFDRGRLIGGKPVPGVGWIFTPRTPVRGIKSREAVKEAKRKKREESPAGSHAEATGLEEAASRGKGRGRKVDRAIAVATEEAVETDEVKRRRRRGSRDTSADPVNEPLGFITFIAAHPLGAEVAGTVDQFSSHGAYVEVEGVRCYIPLSAMGNPPPRSAREVMSKGEDQTFVVQALDPLRRGIELALPGFARIASTPTDETVEAEILSGGGEVDEFVEEDFGDGEGDEFAERDGEYGEPAPAAPAGGGSNRRARRTRTTAPAEVAAGPADPGQDAAEPEAGGAGSDLTGPIALPAATAPVAAADGVSEPTASDGQAEVAGAAAPGTAPASATTSEAVAGPGPASGFLRPRRNPMRTGAGSAIEQPPPAIQPADAGPPLPGPGPIEPPGPVISVTEPSVPIKRAPGRRPAVVAPREEASAVPEEPAAAPRKASARKAGGTRKAAGAAKVGARTGPETEPGDAVSEQPAKAAKTPGKKASPTKASPAKASPSKAGATKAGATKTSATKAARPAAGGTDASAVQAASKKAAPSKEAGARKGAAAKAQAARRPGKVNAAQDGATDDAGPAKVPARKRATKASALPAGAASEKAALAGKPAPRKRTVAKEQVTKKQAPKK